MIERENQFRFVIDTGIKQKDKIVEGRELHSISPKTIEHFMSKLEEHPKLARQFERLGVEVDREDRKIKLHAAVFIRTTGTLALGITVGTEVVRHGRDIRDLIRGWENRKHWKQTRKRK